MKIFIIVALCAIAIFAQESHDIQNIADILDRIDSDFKPQAQECIDEMKLDKRLMNGDKEATLPSVEVQSCFIHCLNKKMGLMKNDGSFNETWVFDENDPPELNEKMKNKFERKIKKCQDAVGTNLCKLSACFHHMPKIFWE